MKIFLHLWYSSGITFFLPAIQLLVASLGKVRWQQSVCQKTVLISRLTIISLEGIFPRCSTSFHSIPFCSSFIAAVESVLGIWMLLESSCCLWCSAVCAIMVQGVEVLRIFSLILLGIYFIFNIWWFHCLCLGSLILYFVASVNFHSCSLFPSHVYWSLIVIDLWL